MLTMLTSSKPNKEGFEELDQVPMETTYCGPKLTFPITLEQVLDMFEAFKRGETLHYNYVTRILYETGKMYKNAKNLQEITIPENCKFTIVGDLHGQLEDLFTIFSLNGLPSPTNMYLFNGDWVDRGVNGCECVMAVFAFKMLYPGSVYHNRGNHESRAQNAYMGFEDEILEKYDGSPYRDPTRARRLLRMFELVFDEIPLSAVIQGKVFVTHGGLPGSRLNLQHINGINVYIYIIFFTSYFDYFTSIISSLFVSFFIYLFSLIYLFTLSFFFLVSFITLILCLFVCLFLSLYIYN